MIRQGRSRTGFRVQVERGAAENVGGPLSPGHAGHRESANGLNRPIVIVSNQPPNLMQMIQFLNFAGRKKSIDRFSWWVCDFGWRQELAFQVCHPINQSRSH